MAESFESVVDELVRSRKVNVPLEDGTMRLAEVPGLLEQLADAVYGSAEPGHGVGGKQRLPLDAGAFDLRVDIDRQVAEVWIAAHGRLPAGLPSTSQLLQEWALVVAPDALLDVTDVVERDGRVERVSRRVSAFGLVREWRRRIQELFDPPQVAEVMAPCVACGESEVWRFVDGERRRGAALGLVRRDGVTVGARCVGCGAWWGREQFEWLAGVLGLEWRKADEVVKGDEQ